MQMDTVATCTAIDIGLVEYPVVPKVKSLRPALGQRQGQVLYLCQGKVRQLLRNWKRGVSVGELSPGCGATEPDPHPQPNQTRRPLMNTANAVEMLAV